MTKDSRLTSANKCRTPIRDRDDRDRIEYELACGKSVKAISIKFNVHEDALYRHRKRLPPQLKAAHLGRLLAPKADLEKLRTTESEGLLQSLAQQRARLLIMQDKAIEDGNAQAVATLAAGVHRNLEIVGKLVGELQQHSTRTTISVLVSPEYLQLRHALIKALAPYPEARRAVAEKLHEMESGAAARTPQPLMIGVTPALPAPSATNEG
jgi:hypothetical protein